MAPTPIQLPTNRPLLDEELALVLALAIVRDQQNPGRILSVGASFPALLTRLGVQYIGTKVTEEYFSANGGQTELEGRVAELCWRWVVAGVLIPESTSQFVPTKGGLDYLRALVEDEEPVLVGGGLACRLTDRCPQIDEVTLAYANQAQACFHSGFFDASVVMLGAAAELSSVRLATALSSLLTRLAAPSNSRDLRSTSPVRRLDAVVTAIQANMPVIKKATSGAGLAAKWLDDLPRLMSTGNVIRLTRNDAGHPVRLMVRNSEAMALISQFVHFAEACFVSSDEFDKV